MKLWKLRFNEIDSVDEPKHLIACTLVALNLSKRCSVVSSLPLYAKALSEKARFNNVN